MVKLWAEADMQPSQFEDVEQSLERLRNLAPAVLVSDNVKFSLDQEEGTFVRTWEDYQVWSQRRTAIREATPSSDGRA